MGRVVSSSPCPQCREAGRDKTGNHLLLFEDGNQYCKVHGMVRAEGEQMQQSKISLAMVHGFKSVEISDRKIREETSTTYQVRLGFSEETREITHHYYPYHLNGKTIGYKVRQLPKRFSYIGTSKDVELFGQHLFNAGQSKKCLLVGGELDAMAGYQMLKDFSDKKYPGRGFVPVVVSLPKGENISGLHENFEWLDTFDEIIVCMDQDEAGDKATEDICAALARKGLKVMDLPLNDPCKMLKEGKAQDFINAFFNAEEWTPAGFMDVSIDDLMTPKPEGYSTPFPVLDEKIHGVRKGEVMLLTAGSGIGKSTIAREIALHLMSEHELTVGNIYLEETQVDTVRGYIGMRNNISPIRLAVNPEILGREKMEQEKEYLEEHGVFLRHFGSLEDEALVSKLRYMVKVRGCDFIILDHISMVLSGRTSSKEGERRDIDMLMTKLASFVVDHNVGIIVISHLSRDKNKNWNAGDIPDLRDLRGSASLEQLSWTILAVARDQRGDLPNQADIHVLKNRTWGFVGKADSVAYEHETGRLLPINVEVDF